MADSQPVEIPILRVTNLNFSYSGNIIALEGINLDVDSGQSLAVIGPNGAGKSTLLLCLMGLLRGGGEIFVKGQMLTRRNAREMRRNMALVFQDPDDQLFMPVLEEDVAFGPENLGLSAIEIDRRVEESLARMNLTDKKQRPPHHLSFGEKRRAALATALAMEAELLLLDEPTSNLDPATRYELIEYLTSLSTTLIIATHDLDLARSLCPQCILLSEGRQVTSGPTEEILSDLKLLKRYRLAAP